MRVDMHTHTTGSDGLLNPEELVTKGYQKRLDGIALTDHDSVSAIERAIQKSKEFDRFLVVPGVEMGCSYEDEEVHILGYFIDYRNNDLAKVLKKLRDSRWIRGIEIMKRLAEMGVELPRDEILKNSEKEGFIGRATIARELVSNGHVKDIKEAFQKYLDVGKPAYVDRYKLSIKDTIDLIHDIGGISVLAHPGLLSKKEVMTECVEKGIMGVECFHSKHTLNQIKIFRMFANENNLIVTGGSDYHGDVEILGDYTTDLEMIPEFKERL